VEVTVPLPAAHNPRSAFSLVVTMVGLAGVAAIFLPFTSSTSPLRSTLSYCAIPDWRLL
jgi:hypothetical protein